MGGNALTVPVRRMNKDEFQLAQSHIETVLKDQLGLNSFGIPAFRQKETFGDIDIIVERDRQIGEDGISRFFQDDLIALAQQHFNARDFAPNTNMLSFDYRLSETDSEGFQIDLIQTPSEFIKTSIAYYSYNDLGNFIGRIAHKMGTKFGHEGLLYLYRDGDYLFRTLRISQDNDAILACLGYDADRYNQAFETLNDIFDFAASSQYFNKDLFLLENRNHRARTRDRKRANYNAFLTFAEQNHLPQFDYSPYEDKSLWLPHLFQHFPRFQQEFEETKRDFDERQNFKKLFNGKMLGPALGLQGKELGAFMGDFKQHLGKEIFDLVEQNNSEQIILRAQEFLRRRNSKIKL